VARQHPDVVARLQAHLAHARADLGDGKTPGPNCRPHGVAPDARTLLPRPGVDGPAAWAPSGNQDLRQPKKR